MSMRNDKIRFHWVTFDWSKQTVDMKYMVGTQEQGGYENTIEMTFELFEEVVDTSKLRELLQKNQR